jgi:hypothetical protein
MGSGLFRRFKVQFLAIIAMIRADSNDDAFLQFYVLHVLEG